AGAPRRGRRAGRRPADPLHAATQRAFITERTARSDAAAATSARARRPQGSRRPCAKLDLTAASAVFDAQATRTLACRTVSPDPGLGYPPPFTRTRLRCPRGASTVQGPRPLSL